MTKKKTNRKLLLIALLSLLVVATGAFLGTLSKYTTSQNVSDNADVAKFGLNIPNTINLFSDSYTNVAADVDGKKIVAPGTSGQYPFAVTGTSEVAYKVIADISLEYSSEWDSYAPLEFSIDNTTWTGFEAFKTNLSNTLDSATMLPNETYTSTQNIYWRWPFHTSSENDEKDSSMGSIAATGTAPKVTVNIQVMAVQID